MKDFLSSRLRRVIRRQQGLRLARQLTLCWGLAAFLGWALIQLDRRAGWSSPYAFPLLAAVTCSVSVALWLQCRRQRPDERAIAQRIETDYPELQGLLLTAVQPPTTPAEAQGYLRQRVIQQAVEHGQRTDSWQKTAPAKQTRWAQAAQFAALALFLFALVEGRHAWKPAAARGSAFGGQGLTVTPGDTEIERGESLVVLARFGDSLPPGVDLVVNDATSPARKIPLVKSLGDPLFGGSVPDVARDFTYRLDYAGGHTRNFTVKVFEHPRLARADAELNYPTYTQLPRKRIEDTRRVSAVEGTQLGLALQLNKPVKSATLIARNKEKTEIPLQVAGDKATASLAAVLGEQVGAPSGSAASTSAALASIPASQSYDLKLVDAEGRTNKVAAPFVFEVLPNRRPELKLTSPRGDVRPSAIEEVTFDGTVWDDFGAPAYGLAYTVAGQETKFVELGHGVPAQEKRPFNQLVRLEDLGVKPDDLVSWYLWADDIGPDGKTRRTSTDLFFAEVRPFEEIFREGQGMEAPEDAAAQQGSADQARRLTELQKQIISATWKLQRESTGPKYSADTKVVHDSQAQALTQAKETQEQTKNPRAQALWTAATDSMEKALKHLDDAAKDPKALASAIKAEQAAYQGLLKLQPHETEVTRRRSRSGSQSGDQASQRQLDELDLAQSENRYETQRQARAPQSPQRREQNQILNRLQELARRQQDVNERLKELQTALQAAKTEEEKEEARRQLKRLQEEQQQMLADIDEMKQRMERPENQSAMQQQRQQLDQTRDDVQRAADAAGEGSVPQALASGTRAQRQLQQMRDELRKQNSSEFADDLRQMRQEARDLAQQQDDVAKKIASLDQPARKSLSDAPEKDAALQQLEEQRKRLSDLINRATQISEQAETSEPLLSRQLYDSVRKISQDDVKDVKDLRQQLLEQGMLTRGMNDRLQKSAEDDQPGRSLDATSELLKQGFLPQAGQSAQRAGAGINELKRGVEKAAESVLGDDSEGLKLAQSELDKAMQQLEHELAQQGQAPGTSGGQNAAGKAPGERVDRREMSGSNGNDAAPSEAERGAAQQASNDGNNSGSQSTPGENRGSASSAVDSSGQNPGQQPGNPDQSGNARGNRPQLAGNNRPGRGANQQPNQGGAGGGGNRLLDTLMGGGAEGVGATTGGADRGGVGGGPLLGENFAPWADQLRDVEELLDQPGLRDAVANARERARLLRQDFKRERKKPDWATVQLQVLKPLVEVRSRITEELARRDTKDPLVPIDRDPVPNRYAESVRRYYEELGKDK